MSKKGRQHVWFRKGEDWLDTTVVIGNPGSDFIGAVFPARMHVNDILAAHATTPDEF
jgi:hypothetical protein